MSAHLTSLFAIICLNVSHDHGINTWQSSKKLIKTIIKSHLKDNLYKTDIKLKANWGYTSVLINENKMHLQQTVCAIT